MATPILPVLVSPILPRLAYVMIDGYPIDITMTEDHVFDSDITDFPVETGADITDNIRPKPIVVSFEGIISDTPIGSKLIAARANSDDLPQVEAYKRLQKIRDDRRPVQIVTSLDTFDNMALKTLTIPRAAKTSNSLHFKVTFIQITQVQVTRVSVPIATPPHQVSSTPTLTVGPSTVQFAKIAIDLFDLTWFDANNGLWWNSAQKNDAFGTGQIGTQYEYILTHASPAPGQTPHPNTVPNPANQFNVSPPPPDEDGIGQGIVIQRSPAFITYVDINNCQIF